MVGSFTSVSSSPAKFRRENAPKCATLTRAHSSVPQPNRWLRSRTNDSGKITISHDRGAAFSKISARSFMGAAQNARSLVLGSSSLERKLARSGGPVGTLAEAARPFVSESATASESVGSGLSGCRFTRDNGTGSRPSPTGKLSYPPLHSASLNTVKQSQGSHSYHDESA